MSLARFKSFLYLFSVCVVCERVRILSGVVYHLAVRAYQRQTESVGFYGFEISAPAHVYRRGGEIELVSHLIFKCIAVVFVQASSDYGERR